MPDHRPLLVIGCGYSGLAIARAWPGEAWGTTRSVERAETLENLDVRGVLASFGQDVQESHLPPSLAGGLAVLSLPPDRDAPDPHAALRHAIDWVRRHGIRDALYLSSTSVHGRSGGETVTASTPVDPDDDRGRLRVTAEALVREAFADGRSTVLRLPGIYGPGRTIRPRLVDGRYRLVDGGTMWSNRIFVDDIASAVLRLAEPDVKGGTFLACDDHPFQVVDMVRFACEKLGLSMPPTVSIDEVPERVRPFWQGDRRCSADTLRALGWRPAFPTYREGLVEAWRREDEAPPVSAHAKASNQGESE